MNRRRQLLVAFLLAPLAARAQQRIVRIGFLGRTTRLAAFREGMRGLGYVEGKNLVIEQRWDNSYERLAPLAEELVRAKVDVIVTSGSPGSIAAQKATRTIPIVIAVAGDLLATGLVTNLAKPGGNTTGLSFFAPQVEAKLLEITREALPRAKRIAGLFNPANPIAPALLKSMSTTAERLGLSFQPYEVRLPSELAPALDTIAARRSDAVVSTADGVLIESGKLLADLALKRRLPCFGPLETAEAGAFMAYGVDIADLMRRSALFVDKIVKGANPGDLPIDQATRFQLIINLKTARALGIPLTRDMLSRADRVIE
ncbi:MAG TPA: ABC transporter substrate-binding protein [Burkholderiales bacterium]|nr:ABC transporter substrate-binding protein [Burkholderiales bacterium]